MSLYTENLQILTNLSKKIDKATANKNDLEALETLKNDFTRQAAAGYYSREKCEILTTIAAAELEEVREVIALNEAIKATTKRINAERRKEAAALKTATKPNKSDFITAYIYSYGTTKTYAAAMYKKVVIEEGNTAYYNAIIDGYKNDSRKAFYND